MPAATRFEYDADALGSLALSANAASVWVFCGTWVAQHQRDGLLRGDTFMALPPFKYDVLTATGELVRAGLWVPTTSGYSMASWLPYTPLTATPFWWITKAASGRQLSGVRRRFAAAESPTST